MNNSVINNDEKMKSKKKKTALDINLSKLNDININDTELSGEDISAYVDALAGAKVALKSIESTITESEKILREVMLRQYCDYFAASGHPPDIRRTIGSIGSCTVIQQNNAKITKDKVEELSSIGIDIKSYKEKNSYSLKLGSIDDSKIKQILEFMRDVLGDEYNDVVSEFTHVGKKFFDNLDTITKKSLKRTERLDSKMFNVIRILNPTIQLKDFKSDLSEPHGFELAYEFSHISSKKKP